MLLAVRLPFHAVTRRLHMQPPVLAVLTLNAHRTSIRAAPANVLDEDLGPCARWGPGSESIADHKMGPVSTKLDPPQHCAKKPTPHQPLLGGKDMYNSISTRYLPQNQIVHLVCNGLRLIIDPLAPWIT